MFNNTTGQQGVGGGKGGSVIASGYDIESGLDFGGLRETFKSALTLDKADLTEDAILKTAELSGQMRGYSSMLGHAIREKGKLAGAANRVHGQLWQHANNAANQELQWQRTAARGMEQLSDKVIQLGIEEKSHKGFAQWNDRADRMIRY